MGKESLDKKQGETMESMEQPIKTLLIVEDDSENLETSRKFFEEGEIKVGVDYAQDYKAAEKLLKERKYDGIITDLFFPNNIENLDDLDLAEKTFTRINERLKRAISQREEIIRCPGMSKTADKGEWDMMEELERIKKILKEGKAIDCYGEEVFSRKDQPLGVLVAEMAKKNKIPFVIATSGHAGHSHIASPVAIFLQLEKIIDFYDGAEDDSKREHLNPLFSDINKADSKAWKGAFLKLTDIAKEQKKEEE